MVRVESIWKGKKYVIQGDKKAPKGYKVYFMAVKKLRERSDFVIYSYFKDSVFSAVKRDSQF